MSAREVHPQCGVPTLIPSLGYEDQRLLERLDEAGVTTTAKALVQDASNPQVALFARERHGHGLMLQPDAWRNQLAPGHRMRPPSFEALPYALSTAYRPDEDIFESAAIAEYVEGVLEAEAERHATLLLQPAHVAGPPGTVGREVELRLAEAAARYVELNGLRDPSATDSHGTPRVLFALILIPVAELVLDGVVARLIEQYGALGVDGYVIEATGGCDSGSRAAAVASLAAGLEAATERPAIVQGVADLYLAYLAARLSVCTGFAENRRLAFPPPNPPKKNQKGTRPRRLPILHPETMHSFAVRRTGKQAELLARAFAALRCECGTHPAHLPPQNNTETKGHSVETVLAEWTSLREASDSEAWLARRCVRAANARRLHGLKKLPRGWDTVVPSAQRARDQRGDEEIEAP